MPTLEFPQNFGQSHQESNKQAVNTGTAPLS